MKPQTMDECGKAAAGFQLGHQKNQQVPDQNQRAEVSMAWRAWEEETKRAVVRVGAIVGSPSPCEGDNQAVVRVLDARPQNVAAWLGLVALSYQTLLLFPCSHLARSVAPHGVSCRRPLPALHCVRNDRQYKRRRTVYQTQGDTRF